MFWNCGNPIFSDYQLCLFKKLQEAAAQCLSCVQESHEYRSYYDFLWYRKIAWTLFMGLWMPLSYMKVMNIDRERSLFIATSMNTYHYDQWSWLEAMNIDRYDHCSYWFMHECAVHAMKGYWSCMKTVDHSYEQALIMHDNVHIHVIMNIIVTPRPFSVHRYNIACTSDCVSDGENNF